MRETFRVLYAEDSAFDADLTIAHFEAHHPEFMLDVVRTGAECLQQIGNGPYDVLLLDNHLPDMTGVEVLRELAAKPRMLPVVMTTAVGDEALVVQALRLGAWDYVPKEGDYLARLAAVLRDAITEHHKLREPRHPAGRLRRRILYVERDPGIATLTQQHFADAAPHLEVEVVSSAADALLALQKSTLDLLLVDLRMPDMSALDLLKEARHRQLDIPIIVITGGGDESTAVAALKLGAYDYIVKRANYLTRLPYAIENAIARFQLAQQATALAEAARQKDEFLAMLSHELRNPLAPIRTALELLRRSTPQNEFAANAHEVIDRQIAHMVRLLDDLLDVARITRGRINLNVQAVDLRRIVGDAVDAAQNIIQARHHRLETNVPDAPVMVIGDATRLVQVLVNLLNNAAKYTNEGGWIRVALTAHGAEANISVADNGIGIAPRLLPRIFDVFAQDDRTLDRGMGGLGLGLTLARRITEMHRGTIEARSEGPGCGSEFVVRLPVHVEEVEAAEAEPGVHPVRTPQALRLLVVEDNVDAANMLKLSLQLEGHEVHLAFDGQGAIAAAAELRPDAIVMDIGLPRMNGYDAARAIRQIPGLSDVLIIALTGYGQAADHEKSREAGIDDHLVKPIDLDALLRSLSEGRRSSKTG